MDQVPPSPDLVELEIAAFMGPHIKRARIALVLVGAIYIFNSYRSYGDVTRLREMVKGDDSEIAHAVNLIYYYLVATLTAGVANIILASIGGKTTVTMYIAMAVFGAHTLFGIYLGGIAVITSWIWWLAALCLGMGFQAAWKADQLRRQRGAA